MAEIYLARQVGLHGFEKLVVLKRILPHLAENARFVHLFLDEARLVAGFDHPHIAHVYDIGTVDGAYFFTMEYVHGQDVRSILKRSGATRSRLPIEHVIQIARDVASALHYAHERCGPDGQVLGVVHRDVSPSNVLVSYDGAVKLLDFGIAKAATSTIKTRTGTLKGKVSYMSPEQARGAPLDRRSDVFSLGIVLWEMVTCQRLYKADNDLATIQQIINDPPPPVSRVRPDCPRELEAIVMRALASRVEDRYATAQQLQLDLEELAREHKLGQSSVALSGYMQELFGPEIRAWRDAQDTGVTLTDHVLSSAPAEAQSEEEIWPETAEAPEDGDADDYEPPPPNPTSEATEPTARRWVSTDAVPTAVAARAIVMTDQISAPGEPQPIQPSRRWMWIVGGGALAGIAMSAILMSVSDSSSNSSHQEPKASDVAPAPVTPASADPIAMPSERPVGPIMQSTQEAKPTPIATTTPKPTAAETRPKLTETKPAKTKPAETRPKLTETKPAETRPKLTETKRAETKPIASAKPKPFDPNAPFPQ